MSALPQRKKTAEEIAKLREGLGIPPVSPAAGHEAAPAPPAPVLSPEPPAPEPGPVEEAAVGFEPTSEEISAPPVVTGEPEKLPVSSGPKPVRSLRRSERQPVPAAPSPKASGSGAIPARRRTEEEIADLRRREMLRNIGSPDAPPAPVAHLQAITAHWALVALGYLLAFAGGIGGLLVAGWIAWKKPRSRHHAGFMTGIAVLVLAFGALYCFPNLRQAHAP